MLDGKGALWWWQCYRAWEVWDGRCGVVTVTMQGEIEEEGLLDGTVRVQGDNN